MTDPTISPHDPSNEDIAAQLFVMSNPNHAVDIGEYWEICERAAIRIRELEAANALLTEKLADREQEAAARYNQWHEAYTNLRTVGAENAKLREVLRNARRYIAVDASNRGYQWAVDLRAEIDTAFAIARDTP
jgi:hypothetical protein